MISRQSRNLKEITEAYNVLSDQERRSCMTSMDLQHLRKDSVRVDLTRADSNRAEPDLALVPAVP